VGARVAAARELQTARFRVLGEMGLRVNAEANGKLLEQIAAPDGPGMKLLRDAADAMRLSARGYHRVLKVARTIADLDGAETIGRAHLAEALAYRSVNDRMAAAA
jgi:magnesium chelatase family protein